MSVLAALIAQLAVGFLKAYWARADTTDAARYRLSQELAALNETAQTWLETAMADPARAARLRVRDDAQGLRLPGERPDPPGSSP